MKKLFPVFTLLLLSKNIVAQNVGIGTTTPEGVLHLKGTNWTKTILENNTGEPRGYIGADNNGTITLASNAYWNGSAWVYPNTGPSMYMLFHRPNNRYEFRVRPDGGSQATAMTIDTGSNVTIGGNLVIDQENGNTGTIGNTLRFGNLSGEGIGSKRNTGTGQFGLDFYTGNTNRVTITNNGNVGINIINPSSKLELRGALGFSSTTKKWEMNYDSTNQYFYIDEFGAARRLSIKNGGNVGINTTNPQTTLDVNGDVNIQNKLMLNNATGSNGQVLVSNGNAAPSWQNVAYSNTDRFFYFSDNDNAVIGMDDDTLGFFQRYAYSSAITYNNKVFTVNKSGLYRFQGNVQPFIITTGNTVYPRFWAGWSFSHTSSFYSVMDDILEYAGNNGWRKSKQYEFDFYLPQGSTFTFFLSTTSSSGLGGIVSKYINWSPVSINLISE